MAPNLNLPPFTLQNLPYGVISTSSNNQPRCAVAIGQHALDLVEYTKLGKLAALTPPKNVTFEALFAQSTLNEYAQLPSEVRSAVRKQIQADLQQSQIPDRCFVALDDVKNHLPMAMGGFSDFYTSLDHCKNCSGELTASRIPKNWWYAPSVYNSRVSSVVTTPTPIRRPKNVYFSGAIDSEPAYGPSRMLDFELEMGYFVSKPIPFGETMSIGDAREHIFGFVLLNDWSARDHQIFEMRPLGPFHAKGFGTSISNWIVPMEALEPFACSPHLTQDPAPFAHLTWPGAQNGTFDVKLKVKVVRKGVEHLVSTSNLNYLYWTPYQQLTHHAASGCGMETGDLIGTGTISGGGKNENNEMSELGCLFEADRTKTKILPLAEQSPYLAGYLEDGDEVVFEGWCEDKAGNISIGFGECRGQVKSAV